ncbi:MAG: cyclic nucleotide-binding domain-containing protein [Acidobacteriota bacterium]
MSSLPHDPHSDPRFELLRQVDLFADLDDAELRPLGERFEALTVASHTRVYRHGDASDFFYVIRDGAVSIYRDEVGRALQLQARLGPGDFFGETGLFDGYRRSSSARTSTTTRLLRVRKGDLIAFLDSQPSVAVKLQIAAARRHTMNVAAALDLGDRQEVRIRLDRRVLIESSLNAHHAAVLENLSLGGLCLRGAPSAWQKGETVSCALVYHDESLPVTGRVSWREDDTVGLAFESTTDPEHDERIQRMLRRLLE